MSQSDFIFTALGIAIVVTMILIMVMRIWRPLAKEKKEFLTYLCLLENHRVSFTSIDLAKEFTVEVKRSYFNRELSVYSILINDHIVGMYRVDWQFRIHRYAYFINYEYDAQEVLKLLKIAYRNYCIENEPHISKKSLFK